MLPHLPPADEGVLYREFDQKDRGTEELEDIGSYDQCTAAEDVRVGVMRGFACPTHALAEKGAPCGGGTNDGGVAGFVDDGDLITAFFHRFQQEHIIAGRYLGVEVGFARQPRLTADDEVRAGTHDGVTAFGGTHGEFLNGGVLGNLERIEN